MKNNYYLNMDIDLSGLQNLPEGVTPARLFEQICIASAVSVSKQTNGLTMQEQRRLYSLRQTFENAISIGETKRVEIEHDDFKFLLKMWEEQKNDATVNEILMKVEKELMRAKKETN